MAITNVGLVQMRCGTDVQANLQRALAGIEEAAARGAQLVCLQELFRSPYFCQSEDTATFDLAEPIPGPSTAAIGRVAQARGVAVVASLFEKRAEGVFHNTAVFIGRDGAVAGRYRKMHIPDDPLYYEKYYFTPGDVGFRSFDSDCGRVGVLVCWDQWFPEAARLTALRGAEILCYPTAIGWHPREKAEFGAAQYDAWRTIQRAHAIANGVFVVAVNRVGLEGDLEFWGGSFVADPFGRVLAQAGHDREEVLVVPCDRRLIAETRRNWPFLRDRRIDAYDGLLQRYLD
ncbi:MAG: carbon-nitrogen hydrolase [Candidatus Binatia bacterium]